MNPAFADLIPEDVANRVKARRHLATMDPARRAQEYLTEGVNWQGESAADRKKKGGSDWGAFRADTTRVAWLIDKRLNDEISKAMGEALKNANAAIAGGLKSAVAFELDKLNAKLKA